MSTVAEKSPSVAWPAEEETANCVTHAPGVALSLVGWQQLVAATEGRAGLVELAAIFAFCGALAVVFLVSTLYHAAQDARAKHRLRICDHAAIYLLIAATYTPFFLALSGAWSTWGLGCVWLVAAAGIGLKLTLGLAHERLSLALYLMMAWAGVIAVVPLVDCISPAGVGWLVAGGLAYTAGTWFYVQRDARYAHAVWHLFVLLGGALHYGAVALFVVPKLCG